MTSGAPLRLAIVGAAGAMGQRLCALAAADPALTVAATVDRDTPPLDALEPGAVDAVIDFSVRAAVAGTAAGCTRLGVPLILGTTGLEPGDEAAVAALAATVPVVQAPNFAVGVNALFALVREAARMLSAGWDVEVVEAHHRRKVDAESGTARRLVELVAGGRGLDPLAARVPGRDGLVGPRGDGEIGVHAVRGGDVVGEHTVLFLGDGESVRLHHRAQSRDIFARGALRAAAWAARPGRSAGRYDMADVLRSP